MEAQILLYFQPTVRTFSLCQTGGPSKVLKVAGKLLEI